MKISTLFSTGTTKKVLERTSDSWLQREIEVEPGTTDIAIDGKVAYIENTSDDITLLFSLGEYNNTIYTSEAPPGTGLVVPIDNSVKSLNTNSVIDNLEVFNDTQSKAKVRITTV